MKGHCSGKCKSKDFGVELLNNNAISTYWSSHAGRYISTLQQGNKLTKRYTSKHKALGLSKCKVCEYITAKPVIPGTKCLCCNQKLSHSIRDIKKGQSELHRKRK